MKKIMTLLFCIAVTLSYRLYTMNNEKPTKNVFERFLEEFLNDGETNIFPNDIAPASPVLQNANKKRKKITPDTAIHSVSCNMPNCTFTARSKTSPAHAVYSILQHKYRGPHKKECNGPEFLGIVTKHCSENTKKDDNNKWKVPCLFSNCNHVVSTIKNKGTERLLVNGMLKHIHGSKIHNGTEHQELMKQVITK